MSEGKPIADFWLMIWDHNTQGIVSLLEQEEFGEAGNATRYFNLNNEAYVAGSISIKLKGVQVTPGLTIRELEIERNGETRTVTHTSVQWKDGQGIDLGLLHKLVKQTDCLAGKLVIHCSSGVGRTSTFYAAYMINWMHKYASTQNKKIEIDVYELVSYLRSIRPNAVQSEEQYGTIVAYAKKRAESVSFPEEF